MAVTCFRCGWANSLEDVERMTLKEYRLRAEGFELWQVDRSYYAHLQAWLTFAAKAEKRVGKGKSKPVYDRFEKFFDYDKAIKKIKGEPAAKSRFEGIGAVLKGEK